MDPDTDSDTVMEDRDTKGPAYGACADSGISMSELAEKISHEAETCDSYSYLDFDPASPVPILIPEVPRRIRKARERLIDSAFKIIELAAGPLGMISIAISQAQLISALKWLLHFSIFDRISEREEKPYDNLAKEVNVPVPELKRMLRMAMANHIFSEVDGKAVCHNQFSWKLARDEDFLRGLPFFCDTVMPAIGKMVDKTTGWQVSKNEDTTARNLAFNDDLDFAQYLTQSKEANGYTRLMSLLGCSRSLPSIYSAEVIHGAVDWSSLRKGALIVDLDSCSSCSWELAEEFPHLRFHVHAPDGKIDDMKRFVNMKDPSLLDRIEFCPESQEIARSADVYLLAGVTHHRTDQEMGVSLEMIHYAMDYNSRIIIIESLLSNPGRQTLAMERILQCRYITLWQLQNSSNRTFEELKKLAYETGDHRELCVESRTRRQNSTVSTVVFRLAD